MDKALEQLSKVSLLSHDISCETSYVSLGLSAVVASLPTIANFLEYSRLGRMLTILSLSTRTLKKFYLELPKMDFNQLSSIQTSRNVVVILSKLSTLLPSSTE